MYHLVYYVVICFKSPVYYVLLSLNCNYRILSFIYRLTPLLTFSGVWKGTKRVEIVPAKSYAQEVADEARGMIIFLKLLLLLS